AIGEIDEALLEKLTEIVKTGDRVRVTAALGALGGAGKGALPVLREAALQGTTYTRWAAVHAIGEIGGPEATEVLGVILQQGDRQAASAAAGALVRVGGLEARELLIEAALGDRAAITGALAQLADLEGEDIEQAL